MALTEATLGTREVRRIMDERDDSRLLEDIAQRRDRASYAELFARYEKRAYCLAMHLTRHHELARDAVQEAMLDVWLHASSHRPGHETGWILSLVTHKSITLAQRHKQEGKRMREPEAAGAAVRSPSPADLTEREEQLGVLRASLERLPLLDRQVLALSYAGGLSQEEIGAALSLSRMAISRRLAKACAQVRAHLAQAGYAAALPLVSAEGLREALCSGFEAPPGLREQVLECTLQAVRESLRTVASHSRRAAAAKTGSGAWMLGTAAAVMAAAGLGALWFAPPKARPAPAPGAPAVAAAPAPAVPVRLSRVWDFNANETPKDLVVVKGGWHFLEKGGFDGSGCMEADREVRFLLDVPVEQLPLAVSYQIYSEGGQGSLSTSVMWERHDGETFFLQTDYPLRSFGTGPWPLSRHLVTADAISFYPGLALEAGTRPRTVKLVRRKDPRARLYVWFVAEGAFRIDNLRLESISPDRAPDSRPYIFALEKIPPSERTGEKMLEGSASPVPGKAFSVNFAPKSAELGAQP